MSTFVPDSDSSNQKVIIIDGKLYDVTDFHHEHPGGSRVLLTHIGKDASDVFHAMHPKSASELLANFYLGDVPTPAASFIHQEKKAFANDLRLLRDHLSTQGYFQASRLYYLYKLVSTLALCLASSLVLYFYGRQSTVAIVVASFFLALFWQQCGWLSHDFGHHQVFDNRQWNDAMVVFLGNLCQGFSLSWWKNKHNTHHASTNVDGHDPDIDTAPVLMWHEYASANYYEAIHYHNNKNDNNSSTTATHGSAIDRFLAENVIPYQTRYYFFVIALARVSWAMQSMVFIFRKGALNKSTMLRVYEAGCLVVHWSLFLAATVMWIDGLRNRLLFFFLSQALTGYMLAMVFAMNHNGMPVITQYEAETMEFYEIQVITSRNVNMGWLGTWFMGGLNYQIEHHVYPTLPRHSLAKVQPMVEAICRKHHINYHTTSFIQGTLESLNALDIAQKVSRKLVKKSF
ncbi:unnamed protein product [Absidia cylindrospora]